MTAIQPYQPQQVAVADYQSIAVQRLGEWAASASAAYEVARRLVDTSFCPVAYRGKPNEATAAILAGSEVGLSPMSALRAFDNIQGQAAPRAITLRAIVQSQGHDIELVESTATRCIMRGKRRGAATWQTVTWTTDQARDLGLMGKDQWKKQPGTMLVARATSALCRLIASDAILGIAYSSEELSDGGTIDEPAAESAPEPASGTRKMSRARKVADPEPVDVSGLDEFAPETTSNPDVRSDKQSRHLWALLNENGLSKREDALSYIGGECGIEVESTKDLTSEQADIVIQSLIRARAAKPTTDTTPPADAGTLL